MKKFVLALIGAGVTAIAATVAFKWQSHPQPPERTMVQPAASVRPPETSNQIVQQTVAEGPVKTFVAAAQPAAPVPSASIAKPSVTASFSPLLQTLVSRQASYAQKQAAWKQLRDTHPLDDAIAVLERAAKDDSSVAEYHATLGQAYVQKLRTLEDIRERGILAMKADQSFDQALELDPSNWEARFWKAASLSYWPAELNKTTEVIDHFVTLVEQQEKQPPQPQFAQTYVLLGGQYQKAGYADDAKAIWQRGASLFPDNNTLREKLASLP